MQGHFHERTEFLLSIFTLCVYTRALIHCFIQHIFIRHQGYCPWASLVAQRVKNPPAMWETWVQSLDWEDPLEKGNSTHSSILVWRIPWTVQFMGSQRVRHNWGTSSSLHFIVHGVTASDLTGLLSIHTGIHSCTHTVYVPGLLDVQEWVKHPCSQAASFLVGNAENKQGSKSLRCYPALKASARKWSWGRRWEGRGTILSRDQGRLPQGGGIRTWVKREREPQDSLWGACSRQRSLVSWGTARPERLERRERQGKEVQRGPGGQTREADDRL